ncbi:hypothetical protein HD806DRAFT_543698 [Xylariaceae sp. AK1471]|nr:hypothetical protein HD806DRAFT_543698 [Xylariaceae sp. AK1471]
MRFSSLVILSPLAAANVGRHILVSFDPTLEGRVDVYHKVEEVVGHIHGRAQFKNPLDRTMQNQVSDAIDARSLLGREGDLDALEEKRGYYCDTGYWYCSDFDGCCLRYLYCCKYGYCIEEDRKCCPHGSCDPDERCCGKHHCYPIGGDCCSDETYCPVGNNCYRDPDHVDPVCCTNSYCTAYVDDYGSTSYASTSTTTRTYTTTYSQYYYWTVTWWYWYYYWTYSVEASIVTSSQSTTSSVLSVKTTDADAATSYFSELSETIVLPTPSSATSLESLARSTSTTSSTTSTSTSDTTRTTSANVSTKSTSARESTTDANSSDNGGPSGSDRTGSSAAQGLWSQLDGFTAGFLTFGVGIGLIAALL